MCIVVALGFLVAYCVLDRARLTPLRVEGAFSDQELGQIVEAVRPHLRGHAFSRMPDLIRFIRRDADGAVRVTTGFVRGPLWGGGLFLRLRAANGTWKVEVESRWVS